MIPARRLILALACALACLPACGESFERYDDAAARESDDDGALSVREASARVDEALGTRSAVATPRRDPHAGLGGLPAGHPPANPVSAAGMLAGTVLEAIDATNYTYVRVDTPQGEAWAAAPRFAVGVGAQVRFTTRMPMRDFPSQSLGRTFDLVYFADRIDVIQAASASAALGFGGAGADDDGATADAGPTGDASGFDVPEGGLTVADVFADADSLAGSSVTLRGRVVKWNSGILGRNWIHVQDGTGAPGSHDITVTTDDVAAVGDTVLVRGTVARGRDFGAGYVYELLIEDARVTVE